MNTEPIYNILNEFQKEVLAKRYDIGEYLKIIGFEAKKEKHNPNIYVVEDTYELRRCVNEYRELRKKV